MAFTYLTPYRRRDLPRAGGGGGLFDLHRQMNSLFADLFDSEGEGSAQGRFGGRSGLAAPAMDVHQEEDRLEITAELPGVKEEDIDLTVEDGVLILRGEKRSVRGDDESGYRERSYGSFERRITLPPDVDEEACSADFSDGVLTITLPRSEEKKSGRRIPLGKGGEQQQASGRTIEQKDAEDEQAKENAKNER